MAVSAPALIQMLLDIITCLVWSILMDLKFLVVFLHIATILTILKLVT